MSSPENNKQQNKNKMKKLLASPFFEKYGAFFLLTLYSVVLTGIVYLITSEHFMRLGFRMLKNPTLFLWNILPVLLVLLFLFFLSRRALFSAAISTFLFSAIAMIDRVKIIMRQEPLLPSDFSMTKEVWTIVKTFPMGQVLLIGAFVLLFIGACVASFFFAKKTPLRTAPRVFGIIVVIACGFVANSYGYASTKLYDSYPVIENPYFLVNQYNSKGLLYSFLHQAQIMQITPPAGYQQSTYDELESAPISVPSGEKPHVIMIMGEAFSDLSENPHLDFTNTRDPLENFKAMAESENAISGKVAVSNYGGGTSNTEYDVLTACSTRYLDNALPSYSFINHPIDALPYRLGLIGYETVAIHPGYAWFYNRQNVYPDLGFETTYFLEDSFDLTTQGVAGYIGEEFTYDKIIDTFDSHIKENDNPFFSFTVTIQNHGPYDAHYGTLAKGFTCDIELSDIETDLLTQYFKGVTDGDKQLGRLWEYAQKSTEPIVIVYFGDHLPGFSNGMEFFNLLDYPINANGNLEERLALYETPYLIWQNESAKTLNHTTKSRQEITLPDNSIISSNYLGSLLVEFIGLDGLSPLYDYSNALRKDLPVVAKNIFVDADGRYSEENPDISHNSDVILSEWQYYKLFSQTIE